MLVGKAPFHDLSEYLVFRRIVRSNYTFPDEFPDTNAKDLIKGLLQLDITQRLGTKAMGGFETIKNHPFFETINWDTLSNEPSPFVKYFNSPERVSETLINF
jgi:3-phosphoinositide dependent protein kinase-1